MRKRTAGGALASEAHELQILSRQLAELQSLGLADLRSRYRELFGVEPHSKNLPFLRRKEAFRLQERMEGGLSPAARSRLDELAPAELPVKAPVQRSLFEVSPLHPRDLRIPPAGTLLRRLHHGVVHEVEVLDQGFRYRGPVYTSLSTLAKEITGTAWNGFTFFGLRSRGQGHDRA